MKIIATKSRLVRLPAEEPLAGGPAQPGLGPTRDFITLVVRTDEGIEGIGYTFMGWAISGALRTAVDELGALLVGHDPLAIETIHHKLRAAAGTAGPGGIFTLAVAAIDIALWDIKGKHAGLPVATLAGGFRKKAPVYASGALGRDAPLADVVKAAGRLVESGYTQMKMNLALPGRSSPRKEVERVREIRNAIGPDVDLMADVNQRWDVRQALSIGSRIEEFGLYWLEDPVAADDYPGLAAVADGLKTPIAAGEYVYGSVPFRYMLEARSVDIVMADVMRTGGITRLAEDRRHGGGVQPADRQPPLPRDLGAPRLRGAERARHREHAVVEPPLPGSATAGRRRARRAGEARPRPRVRREGVRSLRRLTGRCRRPKQFPTATRISSGSSITSRTLRATRAAG